MAVRDDDVAAAAKFAYCRQCLVVARAALLTVLDEDGAFVPLADEARVRADVLALDRVVGVLERLEEVLLWP